MGNINPQTCEKCKRPATYRRACGHFYCETCPDLCDPITHRFDHITNSWVECDEKKGDVYNVLVTVEGPDDHEVEVVTAAIDQMMQEQFQAVKSQVVVDVRL